MSSNDPITVIAWGRSTETGSLSFKVDGDRVFMYIGDSMYRFTLDGGRRVAKGLLAAIDAAMASSGPIGFQLVPEAVE